MPQVFSDPEELRKFATELITFTRQMNTGMVSVHGKFKSLRWNDEVQKRFSQDVDETHRVVQKFGETAEELCRFLRQEADHLQRYLDNRHR